MVTTSLPAANPFALRWHFVVQGKAERLPLPMLQPLLKAGPRVMGNQGEGRKEEKKPGQLCSSFRCRELGPTVGREHPTPHGCCLSPACFPPCHHETQPFVTQCHSFALLPLSFPQGKGLPCICALASGAGGPPSQRLLGVLLPQPQPCQRAQSSPQRAGAAASPLGEPGKRGDSKSLMLGKAKPT